MFTPIKYFGQTFEYFFETLSEFEVVLAIIYIGMISEHYLVQRLSGKISSIQLNLIQRLIHVAAVGLALIYCYNCRAESHNRTILEYYMKVMIR